MLLRLQAEFIVPQDQQKLAVSDLHDMTDLTNAALSVTRSSLTADRRQYVDLNALTSEEVERRPQEPIDLRSSLSTEAFIINGDPVSLKSVISNLSDNAARYAENFRVMLDSHTDGICVIVGKAEPLYRLDPLRSEGTCGSGLGLAIAK